MALLELRRPVDLSNPAPATRGRLTLTQAPNRATLLPIAPLQGIAYRYEVRYCQLVPITGDWIVACGRLP
ncbi:MAG: hypothetical protein RJA70_619 [Pseudomonadota bacterium]